MLRRLLSKLLNLPEPESVRLVKRLAEQLNERAGRFRVVVERAVLLAERVEILETDLRAWERRAAAVRHQPELAVDVARIRGRLEGQIQETSAELALLRSEESRLHGLLTVNRKHFAHLVERARRSGHDVSDCLLYVDLTRPERVADEGLLATDEDRLFVARIIDAGGVH